MAATQKKLKVLILSHSSELAGAEMSMIDLFDFWYDKGMVEPHFVIRRPLRDMVPELKKRGWAHTALYYTNWSQRTLSRKAEDVYRSALFNTKAVFAIEKLISEQKPDVVMTNTIVSPWGAIAAHFQQIPHVWFVREYGDADHKHIFEVGREKMLHDIGLLSDLVVTNSKTLAKDISAHISKNKIVPLYTPFKLELLRSKSNESVRNPFRSKNSLKLVFIGRIAPSKGQPDAAEAVGILNKEGYDIELCVIGKATELEDAKPLQDIINKYGISNKVHLVGHSANPLRYIQHADVGITASAKEAFGRVTFEYMALGRPVIGANSGATPEIIDDSKTGYLYKAGNTDSLVEQLKHYAKDRELVRRHGKAAQARAEKMMGGAHNAEVLIEKIRMTISDSSRERPQPLNYAHRWLEYPSVAEQYINDSSVISLPRLIYRRLRHTGKKGYLWVAAQLGNDNRKV
jgi:glycosyltransferase involved in cell wall biosynthesis